MSRMLFVYGTLRDPDLRAAVLGRSPPASTMLPAAAPGFVAVTYPRRTYPALLRRPGGAAIGLVLTDLSPFELYLLDAYEGQEYARRFIAVIVAEELHEIFAYLPAIAIAPGAPEWALGAWQAEHKQRVLASERANADALRLELIAIRPN